MYIIVEILKINIISMNKTMTKESKQTKTKTFVFVVALKRAVLNGSTKSHFKIFLELFIQGRINCFFYKFLILLGCQSR